MALSVDLGLPLLLRQGSPEVVDVDPVELNMVVEVGALSSLAQIEGSEVTALSELPQMVLQVMLEVGVLLHGMEESNLSALLIIECLVGMVLIGVFLFDSPQDVLCADVSARR
jgi:hypothetical protein